MEPMGNVEKLTRQLAGINLGPEDHVADAWIAGVPYGEASNLTKVGGTLVLTAQRLIFQPLKLPFDAMPYDIDIWMEKSRFDVALHHIRDVSVDERRRSALIVVGPDESMVLTIAASRWSTVFSKKHVPARNEAVATIRLALDPKPPAS
jgi:hypothetical protein